MTRTPEQTTDLLPLTLAFLADVEQETKRARAKFPLNRHKLAAFTEEAGEVAQAFLENHYGDKAAIEVWKECVQAAAMALRCAVEGDHSFDYKPPSIDTRAPAAAMPELMGDDVLHISAKDLKSWIVSAPFIKASTQEQLYKTITELAALSQPRPVTDAETQAAFEACHKIFNIASGDEFHDYTFGAINGNLKTIRRALSGMAVAREAFTEHVEALKILIDKFNDKESGGLPRAYMFAWLSHDAPKLLAAMQNGGGE
ncbi:hypothetical protein K3G63_04790 [Hymenobacter sp. HSC-4F20]|uniref:hypothetical protein n=1 Tax=Hymenobacter sp. HSC-4F20 TaxID=2864135 RepID=UPI001C73B049|nr:hypothetical protein [Hymenobacter sp. HSC-4F20]MBX0289741.1 hypothetical protein [Hymenobacter sp. HSC-4F20]